MDINVSVKFEKFPSLPFQDIKIKPKCHRRMDRQTDMKTVYPPQTQFAWDIFKCSEYRSCAYKLLTSHVQDDITYHVV